jgi:hypothetical protein
MLDDGKAQPGAALVSGLADIDPVEALGEARQML